MSGLEEKQEPELMLETGCAGDRLVNDFVGKGSVHWPRIGCKHGALKDHLGGQLVSQSWMSHFSFGGLTYFSSVRVGKYVTARAAPLPTPPFCL